MRHTSDDAEHDTLFGGEAPAHAHPTSVFSSLRESWNEWNYETQWWSVDESDYEEAVQASLPLIFFPLAYPLLTDNKLNIAIEVFLLGCAMVAAAALIAREGFHVDFLPLPTNALIAIALAPALYSYLLYLPIAFRLLDRCLLETSLSSKSEKEKNFFCIILCIALLLVAALPVLQLSGVIDWLPVSQAFLITLAVVPLWLPLLFVSNTFDAHQLRENHKKDDHLLQNVTRVFLGSLVLILGVLSAVQLAGVDYLPVEVPEEALIAMLVLGLSCLSTVAVVYYTPTLSAARPFGSEHKPLRPERRASGSMFNAHVPQAPGDARIPSSSGEVGGPSRVGSPFQ